MASEQRLQAMERERLIELSRQGWDLKAGATAAMWRQIERDIVRGALADYRAWIDEIFERPEIREALANFE